MQLRLMKEQKEEPKKMLQQKFEADDIHLHELNIKDGTDILSILMKTKYKECYLCGHTRLVRDLPFCWNSSDLFVD